MEARLQGDGEKDLGSSAKGAMGPTPARAVAALADLGLSTQEIARYFGVPLAEITSLQRAAAQGFEGRDDGAAVAGYPKFENPDPYDGLK
jgi:hypothetical protein